MNALDQEDIDAILLQVAAIVWCIAEKQSQYFGHVQDGPLRCSTASGYISARVFVDKLAGILHKDDCIQPAQGAVYTGSAVLCHRNLSPDHIIMNGATVVGIVGWSNADFIPEVYDRLTYFFRSDPNSAICWYRKLSEITTTKQNTIRAPEYYHGIDVDTMVECFDNLYSYIAGDMNSRIRCPAAVNDPEDKFRSMWPEGSTVFSRSTSVASYNSGKSRHSSRSRPEYSKRLSAKYTGGSGSVTSKFGSRYVGIAEESEQDEARDLKPAPKYRKEKFSSPHVSTVRVGNSIVRPTPSLERLYQPMVADALQRGDYEDEDEEEQKIEEALPARKVRNKYRNPSVGFAEQ
ncbi:MAG: hypothetical protein Q9187_001230 [Circinaria calcarea]